MEMDNLFDIGAPDAVQDIESNRLLSMEKKDDNIRFYQDQRTERKGRMSGHDKTFETRSQQQVSRTERQLQRQEQTAVEQEAAIHVDDIIWGDSSDSNTNTEDMDYQQPRPGIHGCSYHEDTVTLTFPRRIIECDAIFNTAYRLGLSDNQVTALVSCHLESWYITQSYMGVFSEDPPHLVALHWDGKMLRDVLGSEPGTTSETLAVLVSGPPACSEGKLLRVPVINSSTGTAQAEASIDLLDAWGLAGVITALVFDTASSNSGVHRGAAKLLEEKLGTKGAVPFALFSSRLSDKQKQDLAAQLHATHKPGSFRRGKPVFQKVTAKTTLVDLIGPESHLLLYILSIGPDWLLDRDESWSEKEDYKKVLEYVRNLRVVNDITERGVKMMSDFANGITTDPKQREYLLYAVEYSRQRFESFKKQTLNK
ncbi:hypothetical protein O3P69_006451 [Scylla paramamosain]|uniref:Uncharacterized protein n=1 Tax=Scylla paramamosain TaxID=85552 RepID=A0AAW0U647_SCYPA